MKPVVLPLLLSTVLFQPFSRKALSEALLLNVYFALTPKWK